MAEGKEIQSLLSEQQIADLVFSIIKHGDGDHQLWLQGKCFEIAKAIHTAKSTKVVERYRWVWQYERNPMMGSDMSVTEEFYTEEETRAICEKHNARSGSYKCKVIEPIRSVVQRTVEP